MAHNQTQNPPHGVLMNSRILQLMGQVDEQSVHGLINSILLWNQEDSLSEATTKNFQRKPISLYISSGGGYVLDGLALINTIRTSVTPVHAYCVGHAMSMAFVILISCHKRFGYKYSTFMYHQVSSMTHGMLESMKEQMAVTSRLQGIIDEIVLERTKIDRMKIKGVNSKKIDWYVSSMEAKKYKIIDEIIY